MTKPERPGDLQPFRSSPEAHSRTRRRCRGGAKRDRRIGAPPKPDSPPTTPRRHVSRRDRTAGVETKPARIGDARSESAFAEKSESILAECRRRALLVSDLRRRAPPERAEMTRGGRKTGQSAHESRDCRFARESAAQASSYRQSTGPVRDYGCRSIKGGAAVRSRRGTARSKRGQRRRESATARFARHSCRSFAANAVRLRLHALAYNLGSFLRALATPESIKDWSLASLKEKLIKIGAKVVSHARYVALEIAEVAVPRHLFADILRLIAELRSPPVKSTA